MEGLIFTTLDSAYAEKRLPFPTCHVNYYVCFVYDWKDELVMYGLSSYSVSVKMKKECDIAFVIISNKNEETI